MSKTNKRKIEKARIEAKILGFLESGRKEITSKKQLEKYAIGSLISYKNTNDEFKQGGFITKFADEYFIYITPDFTTKYRVKYKNVKTMWVGNVYKTKNDLVSLVETPQEPTNFEVTLNGITIYYAKNSFDVRRYKSTEKYKRMNAWCDYFKNPKK
ncbi:hypothetical protein [Acanthamoeba castellanii mimivirus]|uniref:Uncharacterized protein L7 n=5 Tax=Mimivirus TaxID=315393 RepID=YL007_MIMIV|nr:hypothetical protein MIMI_gp0007 [Acanthamoeba polyphaga mimivirus]Q5UP80.1 RecName: Full=Uncharacterized protein L7 [Acanthamoeba polyphaga mimivirus]AEQ60163.1 hypothetical protein [Acanthamoeba castellanii mamavirus]AHA45887.1 hypothetical protein HIRU_S981 [Hirudovirus strain Sangsue]ALR83547.1 hypothetical protein [Niemeyer virus]AMK61700.1 hypothetical protein [Samba virus]AMZ02460.1 hypothetical protein [Mimivirus Bombay]EJN40531.1 hypothetical protein lvs_R806 [Acanthamoeba polyph